MTADGLCRWFGAGWRCRTSREWWGDPQEQFALVSGDLDQPAMDQFIVTLGDRPFAYLQCYDPTAWPDNGFGEHPAGTRGIDQFIGEAGHDRPRPWLRTSSARLSTACSQAARRAS